MKMDKKYCKRCGKRTIHKYAGSKSDFDGFGIARAMMAITTLGTTEIVWRDRYWQCTDCGKIKKD